MSDFTILLVDDDSDVLGAIGVRCRARGWTVLRSHNLLTAMSVIETQRPDVLCIDVRMPTGNGLSFCETLASNPITKDIPVIVLTGQRDEDTLRRCQKLGARYIAKRPDVWTELEPVLENLNERKKISQLTMSPSPVSTDRRVSKNADATWERSGPQQIKRRARAHLPRKELSVPLNELSKRTILIADDDTDLVDSLTHRCSQLGCRVIGASNALEAINLINEELPDLVCLDVNMPAGNGLSVCEMMSANERLHSIPVIILTGNGDEQTIRRCHNLMVYYIQKSVDVWERLRPLVIELLSTRTAAKSCRPQGVGIHPAKRVPVEISPPRKEESLIDAVFEVLGGTSAASSVESDDATDTPPWVLLIDDDEDCSAALQCRLENCGVAVVRAFNGMEGYRMAFTHPASAILLDYNMPSGQGDYILGRLKDNPATKDIPVIVVTGVRDKWLERKMYGLGASAFLTKPASFEVIRSTLARHIDILAEPVAV
jgi:CheY-like chemotaxis protein